MKKFILACVLALSVSTSFAQSYSTINGTPTTGSSSVACINGTFTNVGNINTPSTSDCVDFSLLAGVGCSYWLQSTLNGTAPGGCYAGFRVASSNAVNALNSMQIKTYLGGSLQETASGATLLNLITTGAGDVYFRTTLPHDAIRIEFAGLLSVAVDTKIYYGFSQAANPATVLPVHFKAIHAVAEKSFTTINWAIEKNEAIDRLEVERSTDAQIFASIATLTSQATANYEYRDYTAQGATYYRVKAYTKTGAIYTSTTVSAAAAAAATTNFITVQNPAHGQVIINTKQLLQEPVTINVLGENGQLIFQEKRMISGYYSIALPERNTNTYLVTIYTEKQQLLRTRILNLN